MMKDRNTAILVFACDRYKLLFKGFDYFFKKNWDNTVPLKRYFATEKEGIDITGYTNLKSGTGEWTNRLRNVLDQIEEDYIIFIQEDMWFSKKVPEGILEQIISHTQSNDLKLVKLHCAEVYNTSVLDLNFSGFTLSEVDKKKSGFLMSHQVSIWNKKFLYSQLKNNEHPWRNERRGTKRLKKVRDKIFQIDLISENGKEPNNKNASHCRPGEYLTISANACIQAKAEIFISELYEVHIAYAEKLEHHMKNNLTHDGGEKPRKIDIFKKVKNKFRLLTQNK